MPADLTSLIAKYGLEAVAQDIESLSKPCIKIALSSLDDYGSRGNSRFGGLPDLPQSWAWPIIDNVYLAFIAQINLAELPPGFNSALPESGLLYFFLGEDDSASAIENKVMYFNGDTSSLRLADLPTDKEIALAGELDFSPYKLTFQPGISLPASPEVEWFEDYQDRYWDLYDELKGYPEGNRELSQLLGYSEDFAGDPRLSAYLVWSGHSEIIYDTHNSPESFDNKIKEALDSHNLLLKEYYEQKKQSLEWYHSGKIDHQKEINKFQLLLLFNSHSEVGMVWWDAGLLQFMINQEDLRDRDFSKIYAGIATS